MTEAGKVKNRIDPSEDKPMERQSSDEQTQSQMLAEHIHSELTRTGLDDEVQVQPTVCKPINTVGILTRAEALSEIKDRRVIPVQAEQGRVLDQCIMFFKTGENFGPDGEPWNVKTLTKELRGFWPECPSGDSYIEEKFEKCFSRVAQDILRGIHRGYVRGKLRFELLRRFAVAYNIPMVQLSEYESLKLILRANRLSDPRLDVDSKSAAADGIEVRKLCLFKQEQYDFNELKKLRWSQVESLAFKILFVAIDYRSSSGRTSSLNAVYMDGEDKSNLQRGSYNRSTGEFKFRESYDHRGTCIRICCTDEGECVFFEWHPSDKRRPNFKRQREEELVGRYMAAVDKDVRRMLEQFVTLLD